MPLRNLWAWFWDITGPVLGGAIIAMLICDVFLLAYIGLRLWVVLRG